MDEKAKYIVTVGGLQAGVNYYIEVTLCLFDSRGLSTEIEILYSIRIKPLPNVLGALEKQWHTSTVADGGVSRWCTVRGASAKARALWREWPTAWADLNRTWWKTRRIVGRSNKCFFCSTVLLTILF